MNRMEIIKRQKGQTLIETALILTLLLLILLGIAEFARAWYMKNSLKNAVRQSARIAVVTPGITPIPTKIPPPPPPPGVGTYSDCPGSSACPADPTNPNKIFYFRNVLCCTSGIQNRDFVNPNGGTRVSITYIDEDSSNTLTTGDTIMVSAQTNFISIVPLLSRYLGDKTITTDASMRYEE